MSAVLTQALGIGASIASNVLTIIPQGVIDTIAVAATLEEVADDNVTVTDHPVEAGAQITDHAYINPAELEMRCGWTNSRGASALGAAAALFGGGGTAVLGIGDAALTGAQAYYASIAQPPPTSGGSMAVSDYVSNIYAQLLSLQQSLQPFTVITSIRRYTNMMLTGISVTRDQKTSQALMVTARMRQVILVNTVSGTLAPMANHKYPQLTAETAMLGSKQLIPGAVPAPGGSAPPSTWAPIGT